MASTSFEFADGGGYNGEYMLDGGRPVRHGQGQQRNPDGTQYTGQWRADAMSGRGKYTAADGGSYEGEFANNMFNGHGTYRWPDGSSMEGSWKNGSLAVGDCTYIDAKGITWMGTSAVGRAPNLRMLLS